MNKIRIIDLLNKIANGEVIGKNKIKIDNNVITINTLLGSYIFDKKRLNDEVEVIEDNKKIETITTFYDNDLEEYIAETKINGNRIKECYGSSFEQMIIEKTNEIIEVLNEKN